jgi:hypothetical protein
MRECIALGVLDKERERALIGALPCAVDGG